MTKLKKMAVGYTRVSTQQQGETGRGLELQETTIGAFAHCSGYELIQIFGDVHTGMGETSISDRRGLRQALETAKANRCPIIVDTLDRFSRDFETVRKFISDNGVKIISARENVGSSPATILSTAARAQREGQLISQNTKTALHERKARGVLLGNRTNLKEARTKGLARVQERVEQQMIEVAPVVEVLRQSGKTTAREIAEGLNERGHRTARRGLWTAEKIRRLLKRISANEGEGGAATTGRADQNGPQTASGGSCAALGDQGLLDDADDRMPACEPVVRSERYADNPLWGAF